MSYLDDCRVRMGQLLAETESVEVSYQRARELYEAMASGADVDLGGVGMNLVFDGGDGIPIPITSNRDELAEAVAQAVNFLGGSVVTAWDEIFVTATLAKRHCDQAVVAGPQAGAKLSAVTSAATAPAALLAAGGQSPVTPGRTEPAGGS